MQNFRESHPSGHVREPYGPSSQPQGFALPITQYSHAAGQSGGYGKENYAGYYHPRHAQMSYESRPPFGPMLDNLRQTNLNLAATGPFEHSAQHPPNHRRDPSAILADARQRHTLPTRHDGQPLQWKSSASISSSYRSPQFGRDAVSHTGHGTGPGMLYGQRVAPVQEPSSNFTHLTRTQPFHLPQDSAFNVHEAHRMNTANHHSSPFYPPASARSTSSVLVAPTPVVAKPGRETRSRFDSGLVPTQPSSFGVNSRDYNRGRDLDGTLTPTPNRTKNAGCGSEIVVGHSHDIKGPDRAGSVTPTQAQISAVDRRDLSEGNRSLLPSSITQEPEGRQNDVAFYHLVGSHHSEQLMNGFSTKNRQPLQTVFNEVQSNFDGNIDTIVQPRNTEVQSSLCDGNTSSSQTCSQSLNEHTLAFAPSECEPQVLPKRVVQLEGTNPECFRQGQNDNGRNLSNIVDDLFSHQDAVNLKISLPADPAGPGNGQCPPSLDSILFFFSGSNLNLSIIASNEWVKRPENRHDAVVLLCRAVLSTACKEEIPFHAGRKIHYKDLILNMFYMLKHSQPNLADFFCATMVRLSGYLFEQTFKIWHDLATAKDWERIHDKNIIRSGIVQAFVLGVFFEMKSITFPKFMSLLWFLSKYPPHPGRLAAMSTLIDLAAGKSYLARNDVRELGDFLTALCRSYLVPPPGGMFPDVFFVDFPDEGEQERRRLFDHIREETRRLQTTVYQWRTKKM